MQIDKQHNDFDLFQYFKERFDRLDKKIDEHIKTSVSKDQLESAIKLLEEKYKLWSWITKGGVGLILLGVLAKLLTGADITI